MTTSITTFTVVPTTLTYTQPTDNPHDVDIASLCYTEFKPAKNTAATPAVNLLTKNIDIYPNPTSGASNLSIAIAENTHVDIKLNNSIGQDVSNVIQQYEKDVHAGSYNVTIASDMLPAGVYYCTVSLNGQTTTKKLVVY